MKNYMGIDMEAMVAEGLVKFPEPSGGTGMLKRGPNGKSGKSRTAVRYAERREKHVCRDCCKPAKKYPDGSYGLLCVECCETNSLLGRMRYEEKKKQKLAGV